MISCTEFIPAYSEGFKFFEKMGGRKEVEDFWNYLSGLYLKDTLGKLVTEEGLEGCYTYWTQALNEEAADFKIVLNEIEAEYKSNMFKCPSKGLLLKLEHMEPYHAYCDHCQALYGPFLKNLGYHYVKDLSYCDKAVCSSSITIIENKKNS